MTWSQQRYPRKYSNSKEAGCDVIFEIMEQIIKLITVLIPVIIEVVKSFPGHVRHSRMRVKKNKENSDKFSEGESTRQDNEHAK